MKKPQLSDYNLTQDDLGKYDRQCEQQRKATQVAIEEKKKIKKQIMISLVIISAIVGIILAAVNSDLWYIYLISPFAFVIIPLIILFQTMDSTKLSKNKSAELDLIIDTQLRQKCESYKAKVYEYERYVEKNKRDFWINLNPYEFEREVARLFGLHGYNTHVTKSSGDGGVDIVLEKSNKKVAVQCKHHATPVGPNYIRELIGVTASQGYSACIFVSLNGYTKAAESEASQSRVKIELLSLSDLIALNEYST